MPLRRMKRSFKRGLSGRRGLAAVAAVQRSAARVLGVGTRRAASVVRSKFARPVFDMGPEMKYIDTTVSSTMEDSGNPSITLCNGVVQGTDNTSRIGRKFMMKTVQYRAQLANNTTALSVAGNFPNQADAVRVALVYDRQPNGSQPPVSAIWNVANTATDPFSNRTVDYYERFQVLSDDLVTLNVTGGNSQVIERYLKLELPVRNDGTTNAIADIETGSLYLIAFDQNTGATNQTTIQAKVRVLFTDM